MKNLLKVTLMLVVVSIIFSFSYIASHTKSLKGKCVTLKIEESSTEGRYNIKGHNNCEKDIMVRWKTEVNGKSRVPGKQGIYRESKQHMNTKMRHKSDNGIFSDYSEEDK
jgi:hypothetical protein